MSRNEMDQFMRAINSNDVQTVRNMIDHVNVNSHDRHRFTPLILALIQPQRNEEILTLLRNAGADDQLADRRLYRHPNLWQIMATDRLYRDVINLYRGYYSGSDQQIRGGVATGPMRQKQIRSDPEQQQIVNNFHDYLATTYPTIYRQMSTGGAAIPVQQQQVRNRDIQILIDRIRRLPDGQAELHRIAEENHTFIDPISHDFMIDPVQVGTGRIYDRLGIEGWKKIGNKTDPFTREPLSQLIVPNITFRDTMIHVFEKALKRLEQKQQQRQRSAMQLQDRSIDTLAQQFQRLIRSITTNEDQIRRQLAHFHKMPDEKTKRQRINRLIRLHKKK